MNDDQIRSIAEGITARGGMQRLLHLLGFGQPLPPRRAMPSRLPVRAVRSGARDTLHLHVVELRARIDAAVLREFAAAVRRETPLAHHVLVVTEPRRRRVAIACDALHDGLRHMVLEAGTVRQSDVDTLRELAAPPGESGTAAALRIHRALDRQRLTTRFFRDIRGVRDTVARSWVGVPRNATTDRDALALLLLSRLMFLYFLQRRGLLAGDPDFLARRLARWRRRNGTAPSFYRGVLRTLFFGVLNRRPERRTGRARRLGDLPYLNGGLFERHRLERGRDLDLTDDVIITVFDALLEKYRFTSGHHDSASDDSIGAGVDPEMLGRIFEGLMPDDRRTRTGTFYTPVAAVDALVVDALSCHLARSASVPMHTVKAILRDEPSDASDRDLRAIAAAAAHVRVLDPACGSGAFLLGALGALARARTADRGMRGTADGAATRRCIVGESLHGVDLLEDAALICSLRLWLSLIPACERPADVPPLPNLDRRIRQGDALIDPLDVGAALTGRALDTTAPQELRPLLSRIEPASRAYIASGPDTRAGLRRSLASLERRLARAWLRSLHQRMQHDARELSARAADVDLFGQPTASADAARARLPALTSRLREMNGFQADLRGSRALPFFSFRVHFAEADGFDVILSNPPWVRAHNWPPTVRRILRERFRVCVDAGWPHAATAAAARGAGAQVDLAFLFLEQSLRLLRPGGTLGIVLPAKLIRSLAPGGARALLTRDARVASIEDHSLDQRAIFDADAFTAVIVAEKIATGSEGNVSSAEGFTPASDSVSSDLAPPGNHDTPPPRPVDVRMTRGTGSDLRFSILETDLPLRPGDPRSPWLLAPPDCAAALRAMQCAGRTLGEAGLSVRRGAMTGANDVMIVQDVEPKLGDLARIRTEGYHRRGTTDRRRFGGYVEASALRPVLRGTDVRPWHVTVERHVLWSPRNDDPRASVPPRLRAFLGRHTAALRQPGDRAGSLSRISAGMFGPTVVWPDLAADLRAAAVPATIRAVTGIDVPVIPLNTVYFIATDGDRESHLLAGYLNSMPVRTFARAIAERAKDAHFRFFAWTIAMLPLPAGWQHGETADVIARISYDAHVRRVIDPASRAELDRRVAAAYGLDDDDIHSIAAFDAWLRAEEVD